MKKSVIILFVMALLAGSAFAVDFSASVVMEGSLVGNDHALKFNDKGQKDADLLQFSVSTDNAGAAGRLWSNAKDDSAAQIRKLVVWFKPIAQVKINIGDIGSGLFTEQLNWWKVPTAEANPGWSGDAGVSGKGFEFDINPVEGLSFNIGAAVGNFGSSWMADNTGTAATGDLMVTTDTRFGITAKYAIAGVGNIGAGYRYNGGTTAGTVVTNEPSSFRVGMDLNAIPGLYAFVTVIGRMETVAAAYTLGGVAIDNYVAYTADKFTVKAEFPVTIRLPAGQTSYLVYDVKASYKVLDNCSPYFRIAQNNGSTADYARAIFFNDVKFAPQINLGADYSFGKASLDTSIQINVPANDAGDTNAVTWSVPFSCRVSF